MGVHNLAVWGRQLYNSGVTAGMAIWHIEGDLTNKFQIQTSYHHQGKYNRENTGMNSTVLSCKESNSAKSVFKHKIRKVQVQMCVCECVCMCEYECESVCMRESVCVYVCER